jgi:hypothetical protein
LKVLLEASLRSCADAHSLTSLVQLICTSGRQVGKQPRSEGMRAHQHSKHLGLLGPSETPLKLLMCLACMDCSEGYEQRLPDITHPHHPDQGWRKTSRNRQNLYPRTCTAATGLCSAC